MPGTDAPLSDDAVPAYIDPTKASIARVYDAFLNGKDNYEIDREVQVMSDVNTQYPEFGGTPSFVLNGKMLTKTGDWQTLEPQLKEALK